MATTVTIGEAYELSYRPSRIDARPGHRARRPPRRRSCRAASAHSSGEIRSSPWAPSSTTSSPARTWLPGPTSTITWSMVTTPTIGRRHPPTSTSWPRRAQGSEDAVGVPDGQRGHDRVALDVVAEPVRHAVAGGDGLHEGDLGGEPDDRLEGDAAGERGRRRDAVDRDAAPHEVVAAGRVGDGGRRVGGVPHRHPDPRGLDLGDARRRSARAAGRVRVVRLVGDRAVRPDRVEARGRRRRRSASPAPRRRPARRRRGACRCRP